jgi:hypothetical protein
VISPFILLMVIFSCDVSLLFIVLFMTLNKFLFDITCNRIDARKVGDWNP